MNKRPSLPSPQLKMGECQQLAKINYPSITLAGNIINQSDGVTVLGVVFYPEMTFRTHIKRLAGKCFFQLRQLGARRFNTWRIQSGSRRLRFKSRGLQRFQSHSCEAPAPSSVRLERRRPCHLSRPPPVSSQDEGSTTTSQTSSVTNCTGFLSPKELNTSCAVWSTNVFTSWHRSTLS